MDTIRQAQCVQRSATGLDGWGGQFNFANSCMQSAGLVNNSLTASDWRHSWAGAQSTPLTEAGPVRTTLEEYLQAIHGLLAERALGSSFFCDFLSAASLLARRTGLLRLSK